MGDPFTHPILLALSSVVRVPYSQNLPVLRDEYDHLEDWNTGCSLAAIGHPFGEGIPKGTDDPNEFPEPHNGIFGVFGFREIGESHFPIPRSHDGRTPSN